MCLPTLLLGKIYFLITESEDYVLEKLTLFFNGDYVLASLGKLLAFHLVEKLIQLNLLKLRCVSHNCVKF